VRQTKTVDNHQEINIHQLLHDIQQEYQLNNRADNQRIIINDSAQDIYINSDRLLFTLLIQNIINNALDHALGTISIDLQHDHLDISDEGITSEQSSPSTAGSTGLGLYIVSMICEHLQWHYDIDSLDNMGTRVRIFFR
jgi:signal transduction histidine kinase